MIIREIVGKGTSVSNNNAFNNYFDQVGSQLAEKILNFDDPML